MSSQPQDPRPTESAPSSNSERELKQTTAQSFAKYSELALVLPAGAAAGWLIGAWLDRSFGTHWIYLVGLVIGFIGGFIRVIRVALGKQ